MAIFDVRCTCSSCGCRKVVATVDLPEGADPSQATSGYLCKACGHNALFQDVRRWMEFDDHVHGSAVGKPLPDFTIVMREPFRDVWKYADDLVTLQLCDDTGRQTVNTMTGNSSKVMVQGIVRFTGLYIMQRGKYMIRALSDEHESIISNEFEVL